MSQPENLPKPTPREQPPTPKFYSREADTTIGRNRIPHWHQQGRTYSLTFRLFDSVPAQLMSEHREREQAWLAAHPRPWDDAMELRYLQLFQREIEAWLDQGMGECLLKQPALAKIVAEALQHFEGQRTRLHTWSIMPNHVHALVEIMEGWELSAILKSWKGFTAHAINQRLNRSGPLWQKSYFDRLIRDWQHFGNVVRYIRQNPS